MRGYLGTLVVYGDLVVSVAVFAGEEGFQGGFDLHEKAPGLGRHFICRLSAPGTIAVRWIRTVTDAPAFEAFDDGGIATARGVGVYNLIAVSCVLALQRATAWLTAE